jgi:hypothetical protein
LRRFGVGDAVLALVDGEYKQGTIIKLEDAGRPYRIRLNGTGGMEVWAPADDDTYVVDLPLFRWGQSNMNDPLMEHIQLYDAWWVVW